VAASAWPTRMHNGTPRQAPRVEPAPAGVQATGAPLTIVRANAGAEALSRADYVHPRSADRLVVRAGPFRDHVVNWPEIVQAGLTALRHAAADTGDTEAVRLLGRAEAHVEDRPAMPKVGAESSPVACPVFDLGGQVVRTISDHDGRCQPCRARSGRAVLAEAPRTICLEEIITSRLGS